MVFCKNAPKWGCLLGGDFERNYLKKRGGGGILRHNRGGESPKYQLFFSNTTNVFFLCEWGFGRCSCRNKGLIWLISTVFFHVKISRIFLWLFFTHTRFCFHVWVFKEIFTYTFLFSRTVFKKFSRKEKKNHGWKPKNCQKFSRKGF